MAKTAKPDFDPKTFLATVNGGRSVSNYRNHQTVFSQGDPADAVFYIQEGRAKSASFQNAGRKRSLPFIRREISSARGVCPASHGAWRRWRR